MEDFQETLNYILQALPKEFADVDVGIICGSGLGGLANTLEGRTYELAYSEIPHFAKTTVVGHAGKLVFGKLGSKTVVCMVGRYHFYEGYDMETVVYPIRILALLKIKLLLVTNAAGGLNPAFQVGDIMVISDHINFPGLCGNNSLRGPNKGAFGPRFPAVADAYSYKNRVLAFKAARDCKLEGLMQEGIYCCVSGPSYETCAESFLLRSAGGDAVGMSTVPEVLVACHSGIEVLGLSLITNAVSSETPQRAREVTLQLPKSAGVVDTKIQLTAEEADQLDRLKSKKDKTTHEEVLETSSMRAVQMQSLVKRFVELL